MKVRRRAAKRGETDMYVVPGPVRAGHGSGQWRRVVGGAQEHGNGPDWHWALAPEYDILRLRSRVRVVPQLLRHFWSMNEPAVRGSVEITRSRGQ